MKRVLFLMFAVGLLHSVALGQAPPTTADSSESLTREELLRQQREARRDDVTPNRLSGFERSMLWLETGGLQRLLNYNYHGLYPQVANLSTGSGFAPGARYWKPHIGGSPLDFQASGAISLRGYRLLSTQFGLVQTRGQVFSLEGVGIGPESQFDETQPKRAGFFLYGDVTYQYFPQEDFFGVGRDSRSVDRTDYTVEDVSYDAVAGWQINRWLGAGVRAGYVQLNINRGTDKRFPDTQDLFTEQTAPGLTNQPDFFDLSTGVLLDYRDRPGNPHKGGMVGLYWSRFDDRTNRGFEFQRWAVDVRQFLPLGSEQRRLAFRVFGSADDPDHGQHVPFFLMQTLGGSETLRGFREFRFRDLRTLYASAEYRWDASPAIELAAFYDTGKVFSNRSDFDFEHMEKSFGAGVRFKTPRAVIFRFDYGRSREGNRFFFKFGPAF